MENSKVTTEFPYLFGKVSDLTRQRERRKNGKGHKKKWIALALKMLLIERGESFLHHQKPFLNASENCSLFSLYLIYSFEISEQFWKRKDRNHKLSRYPVLSKHVKNITGWTKSQTKRCFVERRGENNRRSI